MQKSIRDGPYEKLNIDGRWKDGSPLHKMENDVLTLLKDLKENFGLPLHIYRALKVSNPRIPSIYGLPKIHKIGDLMRLIVSCIKSPTYNISKFVVKRFKELNYPKGLSVKNSIEFVNDVVNMEIQEDELMVSFDVVGLFPNIPLDEAFGAMKSFLETTNLSQNEQIILRKDFYKQTSGAAIGNCASPLISDLFMNQFEEKLQKESWFPRIWKRYVDDVFAVIKKDKGEEILDKLNSFYPTIKFTMEIEKNNEIPFLDLKISRKEDGKIEFSIYRKPTDTQLLIRNDSFHHQSHKHASLHSMIFRLFNIPMSETNFKKEWYYIQETAKLNGFDEKVVEKIYRKNERRKTMGEITTLSKSRDNLEGRHYIGIPFYGSLTEKIKRKLKKFNIDVGFKNQGTLSDFLGTTKDKEDCESKKSGIYLLECEDCDSKYIGMTKRRIETRLKEHKADTKKPLNPDSAMAYHSITMNHKIKNEVKLLKEVDEPFKLNVWESLMLSKLKNENLVNVIKEGNSPSILFDVLNSQ
jgi:hypothetical protein